MAEKTPREIVATWGFSRQTIARMVTEIAVDEATTGEYDFPKEFWCSEYQEASIRDLDEAGTPQAKRWGPPRRLTKEEYETFYSAFSPEIVRIRDTFMELAASKAEVLIFGLRK